MQCHAVGYQNIVVGYSQGNLERISYLLSQNLVHISDRGLETEGGVKSKGGVK